MTGRRGYTVGTMQHDEVLEGLIRGRRSVRRFSNQPVSAEHLARLVEAFRWAPSAGNAQPWRLIVVRSPELRHGLAMSALSQRFVAQAPVVFVVCADLERARQTYGERGASLYCLQDTAAATQNLLLIAHALGLGACWVGAFRESMVAELLSVPRHLRPVAMVPVGWPDDHPCPPVRRDPAEFVEDR